MAGDCFVVVPSQAQDKPLSDILSFLIGSSFTSLCPKPLQMSGVKTRQVTVILHGLAWYIGIVPPNLKEEQIFMTRLPSAPLSQAHIKVRSLNAHPASY